MSLDEKTSLALQQLKTPVAEFRERLELVRRSLNYDKAQKRLKEVAQMEAHPQFWEDSEKAQAVQKEKALSAHVVDYIDQLEKALENFEVLLEFSLEGGDSESASEALETFPELEQQFKKAKIKALLSGEVDPNNAIVSINAGAGGTESCDWANMLYRMLMRWAEKRDFKVTTLDHQYGDAAGVKSVTFTVEGAYAYGLMRSEIGIHRLVRISPFDSNARRHTSFASVFVSPEIDDDIEVEVAEKDLRIDVFRSGGAGGQSVNTTDSAVRITHHPSGIVVTCQNERSQLQNRITAMKVLKSRLYEKALEEKRQAQKEVEANKKEIGWGSQIRSYVLHPYKMVKDHRTDQESSQPDRVLDGDLDEFMNTFLEAGL